MVIKREGMDSIIKEEITDSMYKEYSNEQFEYSKEMLKDTICNYPLCTFDGIKMLRKYYTGDINLAIDKIPKEDLKSMRYNCYYQVSVLLKKMKDIGIDGYWLTYKADKFSTEYGDSKIKEMHSALIVPAIINDKKHLILYEPGLKVDEPIFLKNNTPVNLKASGQANILIGSCMDKEYPYYILIEGINQYSYNKYEHQIYQQFNPKYYTKNPWDVVLPSAYKYLIGYKATSFSLDKNTRTFITLRHINDELIIYDEESNKKIALSYDEIILLGKQRLKQILYIPCSKLKLNLEEMVENIYFMIEKKDEFLNVMDEKVVEEIKVKYKK